MPFYLYGSMDEVHLDHMLLHAPNAQMTASDIHVEIDSGELPRFAAGLKNGLIAVMDAVPEHLLQPFSSDHRPAFFRPGVKIGVSIYQDRQFPQSPASGVIDSLERVVARGTVTLGDSVYVDSDMINFDTPTVASQGSKKKMVFAKGDGSHSQDHPFFRGHGFPSLEPGPPSAPGWRDIWDQALDERRSVLAQISPVSSPTSSVFSSDAEYCSRPDLVTSPLIHIYH